MLRWGIILLVVAIVAGCTTNSTSGPPRSRYQGASADAFFTQWGAPIDSQEDGSGWTMYLWYSGRNSAYVPGHTDGELVGNTAWWRGYALRDFHPRRECGVRLVVDPNGMIEQILVHESHLGWWQVRRCNRVFGPPVQY